MVNMGAGMACELEEAPLAIAEMSEPEAVEAADYTARHYFSVDARTFLDQLRTGTLAADDYRVSRVLSMIAPVRNLLERR
jgi:hypothetical protein